MANRQDICTLDFLVGTLSTSYKGLITSLIIKDFCITREGGEAVFHGIIMNMPDGEYDVCLMHGGVEVDRTRLSEGRFGLRARAALLDEAASLQMDLVQRGRHIGTFLLKRAGGGGFFGPALDISRDIEGVNFRALCEPLKEKTGLLRQAEALMDAVVSSKKDWPKLSRLIATFAKDLFWYEKESFYDWYRVLVRFAAGAAARPGAAPGDKQVADVLYLAELPLENETDEVRLAGAVDTWASEVSARDTAWLAKRYAHTVRVIGRAAARVPGADLRSVLGDLIDSLGSMDIPLPEEPVIEALAGAASPERARALYVFRPRELDRMKKDIKRARHMLSNGAAAGEVISVLEGLDAGMADDQRMVGELFGAMEDFLPALGEEASPVLEGVFSLLSRVSEEARQRALSFMPRLVRRSLELAGPELCSRLIELLDGVGEEGADVLLEADVARAVWESGSQALRKSYRREILRLAVPSPAVAGFSEETWAEISDPRHLKRLRGFLQVAALDPAGPRDVLIHLICCLSVAGVFIPDDTLFQRDVSAFLNSAALRREFLLGSTLLRKLPAFHSDVGATGRVRDLTTELDSWGNDPVIYFLRKQVHVNASNLNIPLAASIIRAWATGDTEPLRDVVPRQVFENLDRALVSRYSAHMGPALRELGVLDEEGLHFRRMARLADEDLDRALRRHAEEGEVLQKILLICRAYRELAAKYAFEDSEAVTHRDIPMLLETHLARLRELKETFLSPEPTRPEESLYYKRHIAFGIPSVMGTYHEPKFDAFSEALRVEEKVRIPLEALVGAAEEKTETFSDADLTLWTRSLISLCRLFSLQGLHNPRADEAVMVLSRSPLRLSQAVDLLRVWQDELTWFVETLYRTFHGPLMRTLDLYPRSQLPAHLQRLAGDDREFAAKAADLILRDMLSSLPGFAELDRLLNALIRALSYRVGSGHDEMFTPAEGTVPDGSKPLFFVLDEMTVDEAIPLAPLLGGKALNLVSVKAAGLPVPPAVTFSAALTRDDETVTKSESFRNDLREAVSVLEAKTGERLGGSERPLLLAVRSGSYISMPGVLSSVLYCGMNEPAVEALVRETGDPWFAWDCYGRFITHYADVVLGADTRPLDEFRERLLLRYRAADPREFDASRMEELALGYLAVLAEKGRAIPEDAHEQLRQAVAAIYRSWHAPRADSFRQALGTSAHWGTAVTVMRMVYGNRRGSGSSVFFTRDPATLEPQVYGETREAATGDDLVSGKYFNRPLARTQKGSELQSLEDTDPDLFQAHATLARRVEDAMGGLPQEVETAYLDGGRKIFVLQTKRMGFRSGITERFSDVCEMDSNIIGRGVGVHGGALSGIAVFPDASGRLEEIREREDQPLIVLTRETSTDDVSLMPLVDGIVTAVGGAASHAAVLSQKFDLTAVVGCPDLSIRFTENGEMYARIGGHTVQEGTRISIDGSNGLVYAGTCIFRVQERYL